MEIEGEDGSKTMLKKGFKREIGRGLGFGSKDRTVSRRHVLFGLHSDATQTHHPNSKPRVYFQVIGKNPIWVYNTASDDEIRVFRRSEGGEMGAGDMFCVSAKKPLWFTLKSFAFEGENESDMKRELGNENELAESLQSSCGLRSIEDLELDSIDVSDIDPVKEFGFVVMGHDFDHYPKQMIRHAKTWGWFLEEPKEDSEGDEVSNKKGVGRKRKKSEGNDDDDWTGKSEDDKELITKLRKVQRPKYSTRSKDRDKPTKDTRINKHSVQKKTIGSNEEDEDDDTLGGFIIKDYDLKEEEEEEIDEDEEVEEDYGEGDDEE